VECPICQNKIGFTFGTCIQCGYNHIDHSYHTIEVDTAILRTLVDEETFDWLVYEHEQSYLDRYNFNKE
jgi:hypothetical protein